ncbi:MAG: type I polyketide synthase, partial [Crocinitomicaceae bacterium]
MSSKTSKKDIAIVGISGKFPKSEDVHKFWRNLENSEELIDFYTKSELADLHIPQEKIDDPNFVGSSSRIDNPESFDHAFFGYTREEAALMDPQIRVLHEQVWKGLEDAGYNPETYREKVGCFFSASDNLNWRTHVMLSGSSNVSPFFTNSISNVTSISRLISYSLDLKGPSYFLDTACSSSLVAIHLACRNLMLKECSMAVAGGVSIHSSTEVGYQYESGSIFSKDGHCRAFDEEGSGTLAGEGAGVVVLKRLEDAQNDNDHIYAVIKSTAVNNDGKSKVGYTAPSVQGQYDCIRMAQQIAGVEPAEIGYIEAHGTGTNLGDPIEIEALNKAFNYDTNHRCAIGSVKTNMGHLDAAAGVAGVIKAALTLYHKSIPPSLHFKKPNPQINFDSGPFYVNTEHAPWESEKTRFAGVSSFGIGGTNAHSILQEPPEPDESDHSNNHSHIIPLAAQTKSSIVQFKQQLASYLQDNPDIGISDMSYTLLSRRNNYRYRQCLIAKDVEELKGLLDVNASSNKAGTLNDQRIVFMFAGQGSQYFQMGEQMYEQFPFFQSLMDEGLSILEKESSR